jgi:hypothetical protein
MILEIIARYTNALVVCIMSCMYSFSDYVKCYKFMLSFLCYRYNIFIYIRRNDDIEPIIISKMRYVWSVYETHF